MSKKISKKLIKTEVDSLTWLKHIKETGDLRFVINHEAEYVAFVDRNRVKYTSREVFYWVYDELKEDPLLLAGLLNTALTLGIPIEAGEV